MVKIKDIEIGDGAEIIFIAGPCVIEGYDMFKETAQYLKSFKDKKIILKASYDKANRTSVHSFRGPGIDDGLKIIRKVVEEFDMPVIVDVHCKGDVGVVSDVCDSIQIPAFLCRQTDLLQEAGYSGKPVNIKKGQFMSPWAMALQVEKVRSTQNKNVLLTERGTSFGYGELVVDMRSIPIMKKLNCPVLFDASHSQQQPPGSQSATGGRKEFIIPLAKAAVAAGADGIYCEVHPSPKDAKSDRDTQLSFKEFEELLGEVSKM